jgi:hypothetical protein
LTKATFDATTANPYEAEIKRGEERILVDRVMWLGMSSVNGQVRAVASVLAQRAAEDSKSREPERNTFRVIEALLRLAVQEQLEHEPAR